MSDNRYRLWCWIVYPDSAPINWKQILIQYHVAFSVSPLHEPDLNNIDVNEHKPHYHVFMQFDNKKSFEQVNLISSVCNGTRPFNVQSGTGYFKYMAHVGYPEKQQFKNGLDDIECYCNFDRDKYSGLTEKEKDSKYKEIYRFIDDNDITEFHQLIDILQNDDIGINDYFRLIRANIFPFVVYINSRRNHKHDINAKEIEERVHDLEVLIKYGK